MIDKVVLILRIAALIIKKIICKNEKIQTKIWVYHSGDNCIT